MAQHSQRSRLAVGECSDLIFWHEGVHVRRSVLLLYRFDVALALIGFTCVLMWGGVCWHFHQFWLDVASKLVYISRFIPMLFLLRILSLRQVRTLLQRIASASA